MIMKKMPLIALCVLGACAPTPAILAQQSVSFSPTPKPKTLPDIEFQDASLTKIVSTLRGKFPNKNFVETGDSADTFEVSLILRNVSLENILRGLEIASLSQVKVFQHTSDSLIEIRLEKRPTPPELEPQFRAFSVANYLPKDRSQVQETEEKMMSLYDLLQEALQSFSADGSESVRLRIHPGAKVLLASGTPRQMQVVEQILYAVQGLPSPTPNPYGAYSTPQYGTGFDPYGMMGGGYGASGGYGGGGMGGYGGGMGSGFESGGAAVPGVLPGEGTSNPTENAAIDDSPIY